ncbi:uncharacterized protein [Garra rufa]|uniref:uncharacterized protein isoform X2 n=1 Tax=Garra rufa TaxID=137080 RepID=UPI003CCEF6C6
MSVFALMIAVRAGGFSSSCNCSAATDLQRVEVQRGEKILYNEKFEFMNVRRVTYEAWRNCENRKLIFVYCSPEEKGCNASSSTFLFQIENNSASVTPLDDSELGCYFVEIIANNVVQMLVVVYGKETSWTIGLEVIAVGIALFTVVVLLAIIGVINCICQKTPNNPDAGDGAGNSDVNATLISTTSGDEHNTNDSFKTVDTFCLVEKKLKDHIYQNPVILNDSKMSINNSYYSLYY